MKFTCLLILLGCASTVLSYSCRGVCNSKYDRSKDCQCNTRCTAYQNCCSDYGRYCVRSRPPVPATKCTNVKAISKDLWYADTDRLSSRDYTIELQGLVNKSNVLSDRAPRRLITYLNENKLNRPVYKIYIDLLDNYQPIQGIRDVPSRAEKREEQRFIDVLLSTDVWKKLFNFLKCRGIVKSTGELRRKIQTIWFDLYPRSGKGSVLDTSGFEHIMVGEFKGGAAVSGFHSWLSFYTKEKRKSINYFGHYRSRSAYVIRAAFRWKRSTKRNGTFLVGTSPAYDMAVYTLCYLDRSACRYIYIDGVKHSIRVYSFRGHLATAYIRG